MTFSWRTRLSVAIALMLLFFSAAPTVCAQAPDAATIIRGVDAAVKDRLDRLASYTVTEHYAVFRGNDETKPTAEMLVKTTYRKENGKSYEILSQSGSSLWRNEVLKTLLENEQRMSQPGNLETALINSANYEMKLDKKAAETLNGRQCLLLEITPRRKSQYLFSGQLWVDAKDYAIVQLKGTAAKSAIFLANAAMVTRQYADVQNLPMATHAEAISGSPLLGRTVVKVDYSGYQVQLLGAPMKASAGH
jgi:outer membrane lipoprotein-sorting protein